MKIVIASDSFKGSIEAIQIGNIVERVAKKTLAQCQVVKIPMADGGEGTVDCLMESLQGRKVECTVKNPLLRDISAEYGLVNEMAVMEMAVASGITLVSDDERDVMKQSTYGTGQMLIHALEHGCREIYIGIGGSATNDGGIGFAQAIGVKFYDAEDREVETIPENFTKITRIDASQIHEQVLQANITVMSDVTNPLLGPTGATYVFGKQKGATPELQKKLEAGMEHYIGIAEQVTGRLVRNEAGAGAAGGLGAALMLFTNAKMQSGIETVLEVLDFQNRIYDADLVITGEGRMDYQSAYGKVPAGVGKVCLSENIPCVAIVGGMGERAEEMYNHGIRSIIPTVNGIMPLEEAIEHAEELYESAVERLLRCIKVGMEL